MSACPRFDDIYDGRRAFLVELNYLWNDYVTSLLGEGEENLTYVAADTHHLVPINIVTEQSRSNPFVLKAGLILFHLTIHDESVQFKYPRAGSFFGTTPSHSLHILFQERFGDDLKPGRIARLITFQLKRDLLMIDSAGDNLGADCITEGDSDGVVAGYYEMTLEANPNYNEIRICKGKPEDNLTYLSEFEITPKMIAKFQRAHLIAVGSVFNETILTRICPSRQLSDEWKVVSNGYGLMFLYEFLRESWSDEDRLLLFHSKANIYVKQKPHKTSVFPTSVILTIPHLSGDKKDGRSALFVKTWSLEDVIQIWPMLKMMVETVIELRSDYLKRYTYEKLILEDQLMMDLIEARIDIKMYL